VSDHAFDVDIAGDAAVVRASGELDLSTAPALERALGGPLGDPAIRSITLDLRPLRFIDSTGLRIVLTTDGTLRADGRRLQVIKGPPSVHRVFELALLEERLEFVDGAPAPDDGAGASS
jgi:anti-sigma B factor antagonist